MIGRLTSIETTTRSSIINLNPPIPPRDSACQGITDPRWPSRSRLVWRRFGRPSDSGRHRGHTQPADRAWHTEGPFRNSMPARGGAASSRLCVSLSNAGKVQIFDRASRVLLATVTTPGTPRRVAVSSSGDPAAVTNESGRVDFIPPFPQSLIPPLVLPPSPYRSPPATAALLTVPVPSLRGLAPTWRRWRSRRTTFPPRGCR